MALHFLATKMPFKRVWDSSCPRVYDQWETDGVMWTIQDLAPEDDQEAVRIMLEDFLHDEALCKDIGLTDEPESVEGSRKFWSYMFAQRTSLGCYRERNGERKLVALNVTPVTCPDTKLPETEGYALGQVVAALVQCEQMYNVFKEHKVDKYLGGAGLSVLREFRGAKLGQKLLNARESLCRHLGVAVTETLFSGHASQKSALNCGFKTVVEIPIKELYKLGLKFSRDHEGIMRVMVKEYKFTEG